MSEATDPISSIADAIKSGFGFLESLSPALVKMIEESAPARAQRRYMRRMRRCKYYIRREHLQGILLVDEVEECFSDLPKDRQKAIADILNFELYGIEPE